MNKTEARDLLWDMPKDVVLEADAFDAALAVHWAGESPWVRYDVTTNELVMGGGLSVEGDTVPTIRYSRAPEDAA